MNMRAMKALVSVALIALAIDAVVVFCYRPYVCNLTTLGLKVQTEQAWNLADAAGDDWRIAFQARRRLDIAEDCLRPTTASVELLMVTAANARLAKRNQEAIDNYRAALRIDHRPEIYFNLGLAEIDNGQREQGIEDLVVAGRTGSYWNLIEDEAVRNEVTRRLYYMPAPKF
jgi:hypothetical protein